MMKPTLWHGDFHPLELPGDFTTKNAKATKVVGYALAVLCSFIFWVAVFAEIIF